MLVDLAILFVFPAAMAFAAASDLFTMTISNRVSLILVASFAILAFATGMTGVQALQHVAAGLVMLVLGFVCFARGWIGGGDAKLAAAAALWIGWGYMLDFLLYASVIGGVLTFLLIQWRGSPLSPILMRQSWALKLHAWNTGIPYGVALAGAGLLVFPSTHWMKAIGF